MRDLAEPVGKIALPLPAQPRDAMRRNVAEEGFRNREAPEVLEALQQPVGVGRIAARLDCLSQTNRVTPVSTVSLSRYSRSRRSPGGARSAMRASIRRSASTSASAQRRSIIAVAGRMVRVRRQASTNLRTRSLEPLDELTRRPRRTGIRTGAAPPDARAGSRTAPRSRRAPPPSRVELESDDVAAHCVDAVSRPDVDNGRRGRRPGVARRAERDEERERDRPQSHRVSLLRGR